MHVDYDCFHDQKQVQARQSYRCHSYHHPGAILDLLWWESDHFCHFSTGPTSCFCPPASPPISGRNCFPSSMLTIPSWGPSGHPPAWGFNISDDNFLSNFACVADKSDSLLAQLADNVNFSTVVNCPSWKVRWLCPWYRPFSAFLDSAADNAEDAI